MPFTFVHSADWQIGKPFRSFEEQTAGVLAKARLDAIDNLAKTAREAGASHVMVAGDIYDAETVPTATLRQPLARMARHDDLTWVLLPGNHDPHRASGIWHRIANLEPAGNIKLALDPAPIELNRDVCVLPAPVTAHAMSTDPTTIMDAMETPPGVTRIGLAHGSVHGFGSSGESAIAVDPERWRKAGLAYLALGDWHGMKKINARTWYSGTPEPDRFPDNEPGYALVVRIPDSGGEPDVTPVRTGQYVWLKRTTEIQDGAALQSLARHVLEASDDPSHLLVKLTLTGSLNAEGLADLDWWAADLAAKVLYLQHDADGVRLEGAVDESEIFQASGEIAAAARALKTIAVDETDPRSATAVSALRRLVTYARDAQEGAA